MEVFVLIPQKWSPLHSMHMWWQTHNHGHSLMQEIQHHKNCLRPAIQGYSAIFFCNPLLLRVFWVAGKMSLLDIQLYWGRELYKKWTNEEIDLLLEKSIFLRLQSFHTVNKLCIKRKTTIMVQRSSMMYFIIPLRTSVLAQYSWIDKDCL